MKRSVTLSKMEIDEAISAYVLKKLGFNVGAARLNFTKGDRPFDSDTWSAVADEEAK